MKKLYPYHKFINEGVRDKMTGKADKYDEWRLNMIPIEDVATELSEFLNIRTSYDAEDERIFVWGNVPHKTIYDWFKNIKVRYEIYKIVNLSDTIIKIDLYKKSKVKINEGVRDKMTPKSKEDIDDEMEELEPLERIQAKLNQHSDDIFNQTQPYFTQEEIDRFCEEFIEIINYSHDAWDKVGALYQYWGLSDVIEKELKQSLKLLSAQDQIQCVHDMEHLGVLYTDKEWSELGLRAKKERGVNESIRDKMTPISKNEAKKAYEDIIKNFRPISADKSLVVSWGIVDMLKYMDETSNTMCLVRRDDKYYKALDSFFDNVIKNKERVLVKDWLYWKDLKLAYTNSQSGTWLFSKDIDYTEKSITESVRDQMTPKSKEEIDIATRNLFFNHPVQFFMRFKMNYNDLKEMFTEEEIHNTIDKYSESLFLLMRKGKHTEEEKQKEELKKIVWYLFKKDYIFNKCDGFNDLWFQHTKWTPYQGGSFSVNGYNKLQDAIDYVERMEKLNESVRDKMTPKSPDDIRKAHYMIMFWKNIVDGKWTEEDKENFLNNDEFIKQKSEELDLLTPPIAEWQKELLYYLDMIYQFKNSQDNITRVLVDAVYRFDRNKQQAALYIAIKRTIIDKYKEIDAKLKLNLGVGLLDEVKN